MKNECLRDRVFDLLAENNMNVSDAKVKLNISHNAFYQWKNDNISFVNLEKLANFFKCSFEYLLGRTDEFLYYEPVVPLPDFYERLRTLFKAANLSFYRLSQTTCVNYSGIYRWKKGEKPSVKSLFALSDFLGVTIDYLVGRER